MCLLILKLYQYSCFKYGCMIFDDTDGILCLLNDNASQEKDSMQCNDKEHLR